MKQAINPGPVSDRFTKLIKMSISSSDEEPSALQLGTHGHNNHLSCVFHYVHWVFVKTLSKHDHKKMGLH